MNDRDHDLDDLLGALAAVRPTRAQVNRWRRAVPRRRLNYAQLVAAVVLGFLLGVSALKAVDREPARNPAGNFDPTATIETVFDKGM